MSHAVEKDDIKWKKIDKGYQERKFFVVDNTKFISLETDKFMTILAWSNFVDNLPFVCDKVKSKLGIYPNNYIPVVSNFKKYLFRELEFEEDRFNSEINISELDQETINLDRSILDQIRKIVVFRHLFYFSCNKNSILIKRKKGKFFALSVSENYTQLKKKKNIYSKEAISNTILKYFFHEKNMNETLSEMLLFFYNQSEQSEESNVNEDNFHIICSSFREFLNKIFNSLYAENIWMVSQIMQRVNDLMLL